LSKMPILIRVVFVAALLGLLFGLMEVSARFYVVHGLGITDQDFTRFYQSDPALRLLTWGDKYRPHPYFGYATLQRLKELERLHENRYDSQYVVAILGGSVADQFATYVISHPQHFEQLGQAIPEIRDRTIRIVNLAFGGYKQPQQFIVASYFLESIDMTVNIDGLNEIAAQDLSPLYPTDFPHLTLRFYARDGFRLYPFLADSAKFAYRAINALPRRVPILATSNLYFVTWQGVRRILYWGIQGFGKRYLSAIGVNPPQGQDERWAASKSRQIEIWKKYIRLQLRVERTGGIPAYLFLQPNQYLKNSKPLSVDERATAINAEVADMLMPRSASSEGQLRNWRARECRCSI
jgi:hypothetical protein